MKQQRKARQTYRKRRRETFKSWFIGTECAVCGLSDPVTLEFAHNDRSEKVGEVSAIAVYSGSFAAARNEAEKCTIKCANCHCKETHDENSSWRSAYMADGSHPTVGERSPTETVYLGLSAFAALRDLRRNRHTLSGF